VGPVDLSGTQTITAIGPVVNLAARLQDKAQAGQTLVTPAAYRRTQGSFEFRPLTIHVKGLLEPLSAYEVGPALPQSQKVRGVEGLQAELIGRDEEFNRLKSVLERLLRGQGQIVSLIGEAGLGKSRLIAELKEVALAPHPAEPTPLWLEGYCLEFRTATSYWPFIDILQSYLYFCVDNGRDRAAALLSTLETMVRWGYISSARAGEIAPLLSNLLSIRFGTDWDERLKHAGPEQIRHLKSSRGIPSLLKKPCAP